MFSPFPNLPVFAAEKAPVNELAPDLERPVVIYLHSLSSNNGEPFCFPGGKKGFIYHAFKINSPKLEMKSLEYDYGKVFTGDYADLVNEVEACVKEFNIKTRRLILAGTSIGGYAIFPLYAKLPPQTRDLVMGAIAVACPENLEVCAKKTRAENMLNIFKPYAEGLPAMSLSRLLANASVPPVVVYMRYHEDLTVPYASSNKLLPFLKKKGVVCREITLEGKHGIPAQINYEVAYQQFKSLVRKSPEEADAAK
ncbi:MAG: hypothetical protein SFV17_20530 [Candidatus Obscuribacter sp.]|nr:hypothetical protein [Candidatus Melainabacteria bacterium]MDX1989083.1 hypothetical protein [Candidatus Obscuribacter sp.]